MLPCKHLKKESNHGKWLDKFSKMSAVIKPTLFQGYQSNVTLFYLEFTREFGEGK